MLDKSTPSVHRRRVPAQRGLRKKRGLTLFPLEWRIKRFMFSTRIQLVLAAAVLAMAATASAQYGSAPGTRAAARHMGYESSMSNPDVFDASRDDDLPRRKEKSFWHRPARDTSAEQFELANRLEREGRRKAATKAFDALVHRWPEAKETLESQLGVARLFEARGRRMRAFEEYRYLLVFFGDRLPAGAVLDRMVGLADAAADDGDESDALKMYAMIAKDAPEWPKSRHALLAAARLCEKDKEYSEAIRHCNKLLARAPDSAEAAIAAHLSGRCGYKLAQKHRRDDSLCTKAMASLSRASQEYPGEDRAEETAKMFETLSLRRAADQFETAAFYDRIRHNPSAAVISYREFARRFPDTPEAERALARASELEGLRGDGGR